MRAGGARRATAAPASRSATSSASAHSRLLIAALLGALFMIGVYWLMRRTGKRWWIWSGALTAVALAFVMLLVAGPDRALVQQI